MSTSVLYDAPGPRAKRRTLIGSVIAGLAILAMIAFVVNRLARTGQLSIEKWGALVNPANKFFDEVWSQLGAGVLNTLNAAAWAILLSLVLGTLIAVVRITAAPWWRWAVVGVVELLRGIPVAITIIFVWQVTPVLGIDMSLMWDLIVGLTLYNMVIIAEIVRAGIDSVPTGQSEAAESLGLRRWQVLLHVQLPQAFRVMLPALISQLVVVLKDTSLGFAIGYGGLVATGNLIHLRLHNPLQVLFVVALMYIVINYSLSKLAVYAEQRISRGKRATAEEEEAAMAEAETSGA